MQEFAVEKRKNDNMQRRRRGFTLIEIMVVVVILGILATVATVNIVDRVREARRTTAKVQIESFATALDMYHLHNGTYPTTQQGLDALIKKPTTSPIPKRYPKEPYMKNIPDDPWGNPYIYRCPGEHGSYDIISTGPDGEESDDDVTSYTSLD